MIQITAIIIAKNAENIIADCLDSVSFCDEVIVIDNQSTDRTAEIAQQFKAKVVYDHSASFAEHRNLGIKKAKGKWILYVDADERVSKELETSIKSVILGEKNAAAAFFFQRRNYYYGKHLWPSTEKILRLFKKEHLKEWVGSLHETPQIEGKTEELTGYLDHYSHQDLADMVNKTNYWSETEANLRLSANHPKMTWWRFPRVMMTAFYDSYIRQQGYKAGTVGLIESMYQAFSIFITYAKLWEKQQ